MAAAADWEQIKASIHTLCSSLFVNEIGEGPYAMGSASLSLGYDRHPELIVLFVDAAKDDFESSLGNVKQ